MDKVLSRAKYRLLQGRKHLISSADSLRQCVFLVGGRGTRLGALTDRTPKPAIQVGERPFLDYLIENAARFGLTDIVLLCGYLSPLLRDRYDGKSFHGATVRCFEEPSPAGTAGGLLFARDVLDETFVLCNGDSLFDVNLLGLAVAPCDGSWKAKLALRRVEDVGRFGVTRMEGTRVVQFLPRGGLGPGLVNGGVYVLKRTILEAIGALPCSIESDVFPRLLAERTLHGFAMDGYFIDIGIPSDLERAQTEVPRLFRRPAVFFDRDGVLNDDLGYTHRIEDFRWQPGAIAAIRAANDVGRLVFVITNQSGVARGLYDTAAVVTLHDWMNQQLRRQGAHIDGFYFCPHHPTAGSGPYTVICNCRKPEPGLLLQAMAEWSVNVAASFLIGDKPSDIEAAHRAGIRGDLVCAGEDVVVSFRRAVAEVNAAQAASPQF